MQHGDLISHQQDTPKAVTEVCREFWRGQLIQIYPLICHAVGGNVRCKCATVGAEIEVLPNLRGESVN